MKRGRINWKYLTEQLLQSAVGIPAGGFRVDESGHPVEDYLEADEAGLLQALTDEAQRDPLDALAECTTPDRTPEDAIRALDLLFDPEE